MLFAADLYIYAGGKILEKLEVQENAGDIG